MQRAREIWHHPVTFYAVFGALTVWAFFAGGWKMWRWPPPRACGSS
jgi:hypothetical protein